MLRAAGVSIGDTLRRTPLGERKMSDTPATARSFLGARGGRRMAGPPSSAARGPRLGWILGLTSAAYFMVVLDSLVVITALPRIQRDLHAGLATLQSTLNSYGIACAAGLVSAAALANRLGRRRGFGAGRARVT